MKKRKLKKKPLIFLIGILLLLIIFIALITSCSKEETEINKPREVTFLSDFTNNSEVEINDDVKETIISFMDLYYLSMKELTEYNMMHLFSKEALKEAYLTQTAMNYLVNYRRLQRNDLTLTDCSYNLEISNVLEENENLIITVIEESSVKFAFMDVSSDSYGIVNTFTFKKENDNYELIKFNKNADIYNVFTSNYEIKAETSNEKVKSDLLEINEKALNLVSKAVEDEIAYYEAYNSNVALKGKTCDHTYDREEAYNYAMLWVGRRNSE